MTRRNVVTTIVGATLIVACGGETAPATPSPAAQPPLTATVIPVSGPGFTAARVTGTAGGPVDGPTTFGEGCVGSFPAEPQHVIRVSAELPHVSVMVNAAAPSDTTLAIRRPDGVVSCHDDSGDPGNPANPSLPLPHVVPGDYQVFVGSGAGAAPVGYALAVTDPSGVPQQHPSTAAPLP